MSSLGKIKLSSTRSEVSSNVDVVVELSDDGEKKGGKKKEKENEHGRKRRRIVI